MKKLVLLFAICFFGTQFTNAQKKDTLKTIHIGVIPYQFFSRSCGAYISKTVCRGKLSFEYRPTYTIPTIPNKFSFEYNPNYSVGLDLYSILVSTYEWFYYQGINNNILLSVKTRGTWKFGLLVGYKIWWYKHKWIPRENYPVSSSASYMQERSGMMKGPVGGFEFQKDVGGKKRNAAFYMNFSLTKFTGKRTIYPSASYPLWYTINYAVHKDISKTHFNIAIGFKIDLTKIK